MDKKEYKEAVERLGFTRVVFERVLPTPTLKKTQHNVLFTDESKADFYPTVVVPQMFIGKTLFIIEQETFKKLLNKLK